MKQFILPIILILLACGLFFWYTNPNYQIAKASSATITGLDQTAQAAGNLSVLEQKIKDNYNALTAQQISSLQTLLPDNINTISLITEIDSIGAKHGITIQGISLTSQGGSGAAGAGNSSTPSDTAVSTMSAAGNSSGTAVSTSAATYSTLPFTFSVTTSYANFISFLQDLERSLQLFDVNSITISGVTDKSDVYTYKVGLQTYSLN